MTISRNAMNFGAILGIALSLVSAVFMMLGQESSGVDQYIGLAISIVIIYWGTRSFRDKYNDGFISYGKAFTSCLMITFFGAIIVAFFLYLYLTFIDNSMIEKIIEKAEEQMLNDKIPDDQIEVAMEMTRKFTTPIFIAFTTILYNTFLGTIFGLITALFLKRDNPNFNNFIKENQV